MSDRIKVLKVTEVNREQLYKKFIDNIDAVSRNRLESIDLSFHLLKDKFKSEGFELTEFGCFSNKITIKRNQVGFYVDETKSLNTMQDFKYYQCGVNLLKKYNKDFIDAHAMIMDKEKIMAGYFNESGLTRTELLMFSYQLGYGRKRKKAIWEKEVLHPSKEYYDIVRYLKLVDELPLENLNDLLEKLVLKCNNYFLDGVTVKIKKKDEKHGVDFDNYYGVVLILQSVGEIMMIYGTDGVDLYTKTYNNYLSVDYPYLKVLLKMIVKIMKKLYYY